MPVGPDDIGRALLEVDPKAFREAIRNFLTESVSYFDAASEGFFHGLTLGFLAVLRNRYRVRSNRESGDGRFDIELKPLIPDFPGVLVEVKAAKDETDDLKALAQEARRQIDEKRYDAGLLSEGVTDILKLGLAYHKKNVELAAE